MLRSRLTLSPKVLPLLSEAAKKPRGAPTSANFYANRHIKVSAGYEYTKFEGGAKSEDANAFRVRLQSVF